MGHRHDCSLQGSPEKSFSEMSRQVEGSAQKQNAWGLQQIALLFALLDYTIHATALGRVAKDRLYLAQLHAFVVQGGNAGSYVGCTAVGPQGVEADGACLLDPGVDVALVDRHGPHALSRVSARACTSVHLQGPEHDLQILWHLDDELAGDTQLSSLVAMQGSTLRPHVRW